VPVQSAEYCDKDSLQAAIMTNFNLNFTESDWDNMQAIFDYQEEYMDELAFLEESHRLCSPEYDDFGCYVHQGGQAMVWDFENSVYIPYGAQVSKWPHPYSPPLVVDTDLPEQYIPCHISECTPLVKVPVEESPVEESPVEESPVEESPVEESLDIGALSLHEMVEIEKQLLTDGEISPCDEGCDLVRTTGLYDDSEDSSSIYTSLGSDISWGDIMHDKILSPRQVFKTPAHEEPEKKKEKHYMNAVISFIKKQHGQEESQFYIGTLDSGETCYIPGNLVRSSYPTLKLGDKIQVLAFPTTGHKNTWRANAIRESGEMSLTMKCEDEQFLGWGFLVGRGGNTLSNIAAESTIPGAKSCPTIVLKSKSLKYATISIRNMTMDSSGESIVQGIIDCGKQYGYDLVFE